MKSSELRFTAAGYLFGDLAEVIDETNGGAFLERVVDAMNV